MLKRSGCSGEHIDLEAGTIYVARGKGGRSRIVPIRSDMQSECRSLGCLRRERCLVQYLRILMYTLTVGNMLKQFFPSFPVA